MCGIAGYIGAQPLGVLENMCRSIAHRGPDAAAITRLHTARGTEVGLAHTRLAIIDCDPRSTQPMESARKSVIVFNGEIYNYKALRAELRAKGHRFRTESDTEVLLAGYDEWGEAVLDRLDGMYAVAIWNPVNDELFLARDPFGVKPLYWCRTPTGGFAFASELKALLCVPALSTDLDHRAVVQYMTFLWTPADRTMLAGVKKLEPGARVHVAASTAEPTIENRNIWDARQSTADSFADAADNVRSLLRSAVHRQLGADVEVGTFLSGGVDSTAIAAFARERGPLRGYTIATTLDAQGRAGFAADLPYARQAARALDIELIEVEDVCEDLEAELRDAIWHLDEPQADPAILSTRRIAAAARQANTLVLLSGAGGDDLFGGYRRHQAIRAERYWSWLPQPVRAAVGRTASGLPDHPAAFRRLHKLLQHAGATDCERLAGYFSWASPGQLGCLLNGDVIRDLRSLDPTDDLLCSLGNLSNGQSPLDRALALELRHFLAAHNLNYTDKLSMAEGVEVRVPFLDSALSSYAMGLPDAFRVRRGHTKAVLKHALKNDIPSGIIDRSKTGFGGALRDRHQRTLVDVARSVLESPEARDRYLFEPKGVSNLIRSAPAHSGSPTYFQLLALLVIEIWCQALPPTSSAASACRIPIRLALDAATPTSR